MYLIPTVYGESVVKESVVLQSNGTPYIYVEKKEPIGFKMVKNNG